MVLCVVQLYALCAWQKSAIQKREKIGKNRGHIVWIHVHTAHHTACILEIVVFMPCVVQESLLRDSVSFFPFTSHTFIHWITYRPKIVFFSFFYEPSYVTHKQKLQQVLCSAQTYFNAQVVYVCMVSDWIGSRLRSQLRFSKPSAKRERKHTYRIFLQRTKPMDIFVLWVYVYRRSTCLLIYIPFWNYLGFFVLLSYPYTLVQSKCTRFRFFHFGFVHGRLMRSELK